MSPDENRARLKLQYEMMFTSDCQREIYYVV